jgi:hypothetical protein
MTDSGVLIPVKGVKIENDGTILRISFFYADCYTAIEAYETVRQNLQENGNFAVQITNAGTLEES